MATLFGTYTTGIHLNNPTAQNPTTLASGGYITNTLARYNGDAVYGNNAAAWYFENLGTIKATATSGDGIQFVAGGTVVNFGSITATGANGLGVALDAGGTVTNTGTGLIEAAAGGIFIVGGAGTVVNSATVVETGFGGAGIVLGLGGSVANLGTVEGIGTSNDGIYLTNGGSVTNGHSGSAAGYVAGGFNGVAIAHSAGTVVNFGTIIGTGTASHGVVLTSGGSVTNYGTIEALGSVVNGSGSIVAGNAVNLQNGGLVTNGASGSPGGLILGYHIGIITSPTASANVVNFGTIQATQTAVNGISGDAVQLQGGGSVANYGLIEAAQFGVSIGVGGTAPSGVGTVTNLGTIAVSGHVTVASGVTLYPTAVLLSDGGIVTNGRSGTASGLIDSGSSGITIKGRPGTIVNFGTIETTGTLLGPRGAHSNPIGMVDSGLVLNGASGATGALIIGYERAIYGGGANGTPVAGAVITVVNWGTLAETATGTVAANNVALAAGGTVINYGVITSAVASNVAIGNTTVASTGTVSNLGTITVLGGTIGAGIYLGDGGLITNGQSGSGLGLVTSAWQGVSASNVRATVVNFGTLESSGTVHNSGGFSPSAVRLGSGGLLVNGTSGDTSALIVAYQLGVVTGQTSGIPTLGDIATIVNFGTIAATGTGAVASNAMRLGAGGTLDNYGLVTSALATAVSIGGTTVASAGSVFNLGTITQGGTTSGAAIYLGGGGIVTNGSTGVTAGSITSSHTGISFKNTAGTVVNLGTVQSTAAGTSGDAVYFNAGGIVENGASNVGTAVIISSLTGISFKNVAGSVANYGTVTGSGGAGIYMAAGGQVSNFGTVQSSGTHSAISTLGTTAGGAGTILNLGVIENTGSYVGVHLQSGYVENGLGGSTAGQIIGVTDAVYVGGPTATSAANAGTVVNFATIAGTGAAGTGVRLAGGGLVVNETNGVISGYTSGVDISHVGGSVVNVGMITGTGDLGIGVYIYSGLVFNSGRIHGYNDGVAVGHAGTVINLGTIDPAVIGGDGVSLGGGGLVVNGTGGTSASLIQGANAGVDITGAGGVVINFASITSGGGASDGIYLGAGGTVANYGTVAALADGTGIGVSLGQGGTLTNAAGATIYGDTDGVVVGGTSGGLVINYGTIEGRLEGVVLNAAGATVVNSGTIAGLYGINSVGVYLGAGGVVVNGQSGAPAGSITGAIGVEANNVAATVVNYATIAAYTPGYYFGAAIVLSAGGSIVNSGTVEGLGADNGGILVQSLGATITNQQIGLVKGAHGIYVNSGSGTVVNLGTVEATLYRGVLLAGGGTVTNGASGSAGGLITSPLTAITVVGTTAAAVLNFGTLAGTGTSGIGVYFGPASGTLLDAGTITGAGGTAVAFAGGGNRVILEPGAMFQGVVNGGTGNDTLELTAGAGSGRVSGIGTNFTGFTALTFDAGALWQVGGSAAALEADTITGFAPGDTIDLAGVVANGDSYAGGVLTLTNGGTVAAQLTLATTLAKPVFQLAADGGGGTLITLLSHPPNVFSGTYFSTIVLDTPTTQNPATVTGTGVVEVTNEVGILGTAGFPWTLSNYGTVTVAGSVGDAIDLTAGGLFTNAGLVAGISAGVMIDGATGTVLNSGHITASGVGVRLGAGGTVVDTGVISGMVGISDVGGRIVDAGVIIGTGGTALALSGGALVLEPGAVVTGVAIADASTVLELAAGAGTGTLSGLGTSFAQFGALLVDPGAVWQVGGSPGTPPPVTNDSTILVQGSLSLGALGEDAGQQGVIELEAGARVELAGNVAAGQTVVFASQGATAQLDQPGGFAGAITGFAIGDTIDLTGLVADTAQYAGGTLSLSSSGTPVLQLRLQTPVTNPDFVLTPDGKGDTAITLASGSAGPVHWIGSGGTLSGDFDQALNWSPAVVPGAYNVAALDAPGGVPYTVTSGLDNSVAGVSLLADASLVVAAGYFASAGITNAGTVTVDTGAALTVGGSLLNNGVMTAQGGSLTLDPGSGVYLDNAGTLSTRAGGNLTIVGSLGNTGTIGASGGGSLTIAYGGAVAGYGLIRGPLANQGRLEAQGGTLTLRLDVANSGIIAVDAYATLAAATIDGGGTITVAGLFAPIGVATLSGGGQVMLAGGAIGGGGSLVETGGTIAGYGLLAGGLVNQAGGVVEAAGGRLTLAAGYTLANSGGVGAIAGGAMVIAGTLVNAGSVGGLGGRVTIAAPGAVVGAGLISGGLVNRGLIEAQGGSLTLAGTVLGTGSALIADGAALVLGAGDSQTVAFAGGTGELLLQQPALFTGAIAGFAPGEGIDLAGLAADTASYAGGLLTLYQSGAAVAQLNLSTPVAGPIFSLSADGYGDGAAKGRPRPRRHLSERRGAQQPRREPGGGRERRLHHQRRHRALRGASDRLDDRQLRPHLRRRTGRRRHRAGVGRHDHQRRRRAAAERRRVCRARCGDRRLRYRRRDRRRSRHGRKQFDDRGNRQRRGRRRAAGRRRDRQPGAGPGGGRSCRRRQRDPGQFRHGRRRERQRGGADRRRRPRRHRARRGVWRQRRRRRRRPRAGTGGAACHLDRARLRLFRFRDGRGRRRGGVDARRQ
jgi:hypothetical protein